LRRFLGSLRDTEFEIWHEYQGADQPVRACGPHPAWSGPLGFHRPTGERRVENVLLTVAARRPRLTSMNGDKWISFGLATANLGTFELRNEGPQSSGSHGHEDPFSSQPAVRVGEIHSTGNMTVFASRFEKR
jgi:hypothetical protein